MITFIVLILCETIKAHDTKIGYDTDEGWCFLHSIEVEIHVTEIEE